MHLLDHESLGNMGMMKTEHLCCIYSKRSKPARLEEISWKYVTCTATPHTYHAEQARAFPNISNLSGATGLFNLLHPTFILTQTVRRVSATRRIATSPQAPQFHPRLTPAEAE